MRTKDIDLIIQLIVLYHASPDKKGAEHADYTFDKNGISYLLGQTIRQLWLPKDHYLISAEAQKWWDENAEGRITDFSYQDCVTVKHDISINVYIGNKKEPEKNPESRKSGDKFVYRSFFHDEHIVPVSTIKKELLELKVITVESVENVLSKIYVCKMLKEEDKKIPKKYNRGSDDYLEIIKTHYKNIEICGIEKEKRLWK